MAILGLVRGGAGSLRLGALGGGAAAGFLLALWVVAKIEGSVSVRGHGDDRPVGEPSSMRLAVLFWLVGLLCTGLYFVLAWPGVRLARALRLYVP